MSALEAELAQLRPALHRYAARMVGSTIDGEDVVQDALLRAQTAIAGGLRPAALRNWLFRIAHNCAVDHLRREALRRAEPLEEADAVADDRIVDAADRLIRQEAVTAALSRFMRLPLLPRSAVILKDVLDHSNEEIAALLDCSLAAVKAALHRGRARLEQSATADQPAPPTAASEELARYVALFNRRDWMALRALLADEVRLIQTARAERQGVEAVAASFFAGYQAVEDWMLVPAWLEGREVAAVLDPANGSLAYFTILEWDRDHITHIRDFRHARYVLDGARVTLLQAAGDRASAGRGS